MLSPGVTGSRHLPRLAIPSLFGVAFHRQALYGTVTPKQRVFCNAVRLLIRQDGSRSVYDFFFLYFVVFFFFSLSLFFSFFAAPPRPLRFFSFLSLFPHFSFPSL